MFSFGKKKKKDEKSDSKSIEREAVEVKEAEERASMKDSVIIHTMPKKFLKVTTVSSSGESSKGIGILILLFGLALMAGISVFAYFIFFKKEPQSENNLLNPDVVQVEPVIQEEPVDPVVVKEPIKEVPVIEKPVVVATTTPEVATSTPDIVPPVVIEKPKPKVLIDADKDGLSATEEMLLGTKDSLADSDGDGYTDLSELFNLFNPAGDGSIMVNSGVEKYTNSQFSYSIYYMKPWELKAVNAGESVIFKIKDSQFIQVIAQENLKKQSLEAWYKEQFEVGAVKNSQIVYKKGWNAIKSDTSDVVYLTSANSKYIFTFMSSIESEYEAIAEMMLNSFEVIK